MSIQRRILNVLVPSILATFLAVGLLSSPANAAANKPTSKVTSFGILPAYKGVTETWFFLSHTGGPIKNAKMCWESTSYCVAVKGDGVGGWLADFKVNTKKGQSHKVALYYTIDGYGFSHTLKAIVADNGGVPIQ